jgi:hypothetical protein
MASLARLRQLVAQCANSRCEYCGLSELGQAATFYLDHITPIASGGGLQRKITWLTPVCIAPCGKVLGSMHQILSRGPLWRSSIQESSNGTITTGGLVWSWLASQT